MKNQAKRMEIKNKANKTGTSEVNYFQTDN